MMRSFRTTLVAIAVCALASVPAFAGSPLPEIEPNDSFASAQLIDRVLFGPTGSVSILGSLTPGDVDYYQVPLLAGDFISAQLVVVPSSPSNKSALGAFTPSGSLVAYDLFAPNVLTGAIPTSGNWRIAVSGYPDVGSTFLGDDGIPFNGTHGESINYLLTLSLVPVPEPGGVMALGTGIVGLLGYSIRRRRAG